MGRKVKGKPPTKYCNGQRANQPEGVLCKRTAGAGTDHVGIGRCSRHGGAAPSYAAEVERLRAVKTVEQFGLPKEIDPREALEHELHRTVGHVEWLRLEVAKLETEKMVGPVGGGQGGIPEWKPNVWINLYGVERDRLVKVAKACVEAGVELRKVELAETQGLLIAFAIKSVLEILGLAKDPRVPEVVGRVLRELPSGADAIELGESLRGELVTA